MRCVLSGSKHTACETLKPQQPMIAWESKRSVLEVWRTGCSRKGPKRSDCGERLYLLWWGKACRKLPASSFLFLGTQKLGREWRGNYHSSQLECSVSPGRGACREFLRESNWKVLWVLGGVRAEEFQEKVCTLPFSWEPKLQFLTLLSLFF